jgi:hypothetical protein
VLGGGTDYPEILRGTLQSLLNNAASLRRLDHDHFLPAHLRSNSIPADVI